MPSEHFWCSSTRSGMIGATVMSRMRIGMSATRLRECGLGKLSPHSHGVSHTVSGGGATKEVHHGRQNPCWGEDAVAGAVGAGAAEGGQHPAFGPGRGLHARVRLLEGPPWLVAGD